MLKVGEQLNPPNSNQLVFENRLILCLVCAHAACVYALPRAGIIYTSNLYGLRSGRQWCVTWYWWLVILLIWLDGLLIVIVHSRLKLNSWLSSVNLNALIRQLKCSSRSLDRLRLTNKAAYIYNFSYFSWIFW